MADSKLSDLTSLTSVAAGDLFYVVDISDTTDSVAGTSKKITLEKVLTTPTVTGTLSVLQSGGTPGTDELQIYHNGADVFFLNKDSTDTGNEIIFEPYSGGPQTKISYFGIVTPGVDSSGTGIFRTNDGIYIGASLDSGFARIAAGVAAPYLSYGSVAGWIQNTGGVAQLNANFTSTSTTMANTNLSRTVITGRSYAFRLLLPINNATAGDGFKCDFDGGNATMTTFLACAKTAGTITEGVVTSAALDTDFTFTSATSTSFVIIEGSIKVNAGGTLTLRAAKNSDAAGATMTLLAGARLELNDMVAV